VAADAGEPFGGLVGGELVRPDLSNGAESLAGVLEEGRERLCVLAHDRLDGLLEAGEQSLAGTLLDLGDLGLQLVRVFDPRDGGFADGVLLGPPLCDGDRKSTRLNSSHVSISYAVFCLKKKNESR